MSDELKTILGIVSILAILSTTIASCVAYQAHKNTEVVVACLERTENVTECALFDSQTVQRR